MSNLDFSLALNGMSVAYADSRYAAKNSVQTSAPAAGGTVAIAAPNSTLVLSPAGLLATLTVTLPASPADGDRVSIKSTQIVTALTLSGGSVADTVAALAVGPAVDLMYDATAGVWRRV